MACPTTQNGLSSMTDAGPEIILVSASPRRRELLRAAGYRPQVCPAGAPEDLTAGDARAVAVAIATQKLDVLAARLAARPEPRLDGGPWLAADTVVVLEGRILGKPRGVAEAKQMLQALSGAQHEVVTGVALRMGTVHHAFAVTTQVSFRPLSHNEICRYVATGEPMDKAGAYGIQGHGGALVQAVYGSYTNVIGLPMFETIAALTHVCEAALQ